MLVLAILFAIIHLLLALIVVSFAMEEKDVERKRLARIGLVGILTAPAGIILLPIMLICLFAYLFYQLVLMALGRA